MPEQRGKVPDTASKRDDEEQVAGVVIPPESEDAGGNAGDRGADTASPATVNVIMRARRPWAVGETIGLSRGYSFAPGVPVEVAAADAAILVGREWDGRRFLRA